MGFFSEETDVLSARGVESSVFLAAVLRFLGAVFEGASSGSGVNNFLLVAAAPLAVLPTAAVVFLLGGMLNKTVFVLRRLKPVGREEEIEGKKLRYRNVKLMNNVSKE